MIAPAPHDGRLRLGRANPDEAQPLTAQSHQGLANPGFSVVASRKPVVFDSMKTHTASISMRDCDCARFALAYC